MKKILILLVTVFCSLLLNASKAQTAAADNKLSKSITFRPIPKGPAVYGVFEGRPPCREIAKQVDSPVSAECTKVKWSLILYKDSITKQPTVYHLLGRFLPPDGKWKIIKGIK